MKTLLISDLHLTAKPQDSYRWALKQKVLDLITPHQITDIVILGDLTDAKDFHSSILVNKVVDLIMTWQEKVDDIWILRGNHDGLGEEAYFEFLKHYQGVHFISQPTYLTEANRDEDFYLSEYSEESTILFLPHSRNPMEDWKHLDLRDKIIFAHATVNGALAESLIRLESQIDPFFFRDAKRTFSGDIHKPQEVGPVVYVGAPYQCRYGDAFQGGAIIFDTVHNAKYHRISFDFPEKVVFDVDDYLDFEKSLEHLLDEISNVKLPHSVKVRMKITEKNLKTWRDDKDQIEDSIKRLGWVLGIFETSSDLLNQVHQQKPLNEFMNFDTFCTQEKISEGLKSVGKQILEEVEIST